MYILLILSTAGTIFFFGITLILLFKKSLLKKTLMEREDIAKRRIYEITILKAIQERIGYSLNTEHVIDTLTNSLKSLFPYSAASSILIINEKVIFKCILEERVSGKFIDQVKKSMLASFATLSGSPINTIEEIRQGLVVDDLNTKMVASFFNVPIIVNGKAVGLLNVSSTHPGLYKEADMTIMYQMATAASSALTNLQQVIQTEEGKLVSMIGSLTDGIVMVDTNLNLTLINQTAKNLLQIPKTNMTIFDIISSLSKDGDFGQQLQQAIAQNKVLTKPEIIIGEKILEVVITPVAGPTTNSESEPIRVIGAAITLRDITLERSVNKLKEDFTASIVHELRSPLSAIKASSELMLTEKEKLDALQQKKLMEIVHTQSERMLHDINSLLDAAKLESGHFTIFQKASNIADSIASVIDLFRLQAGEKHIEISADIGKDVPLGFFDETRIQQVLNNLVSNSLKFTPEGGSIILHARKYSNEYLPVSKTNPGILIAVSDTGIGIAADKQTTLFSKFSQIQNVGYIHGAQGTGLGLYISKGIIEAHGGQVFLQSIPGHGTTISFTLPIAKTISVDQTISETSALPTPLMKTTN